MNSEIKVVVSKHFVTVCEFMGIEPDILLERFIDNILCFEEMSKPDSVERMLAIRYFLTYSDNRNKVHDYHVKVKDAYINKTLPTVDNFLAKMHRYRDGESDKAFDEFIEDWHTKWSGVVKVCTEDSKEAEPSEVNAGSVREIPPFDTIALDTVAEVVLTKSDKEKIEIESIEATDRSIDAKVTNKRLYISTVFNHENIHRASKVIIHYVTLSSITIHHAHTLTCTEPIEAPRLDIFQNSDRDISFEVDVMQLDVALTKRGNLTITGSTDQCTVLNHRSGNFNGENLDATAAKIVLRGSGNVSIQVEDELIAYLKGPGNLHYRGNPRLKSLIVDGTGRLKQF